MERKRIMQTYYENVLHGMRRPLLLVAVAIVALLSASGVAMGVTSTEGRNEGHAVKGAASDGLTTRAASSDVSAAAKMKNFTKSSMKPQSGDGDPAGTVLANGARITAPDNPYSFRKTRKIASLKQVTITATLYDGDTGTGSDDVDEDDLFLALDGINTGIALNGFYSGQVDTRTNSGIPNHREALKAALKEDRKLAATIIDRDAPNNLRVPASRQTTLQIKGTLTR
jgi:hypothetical protein